MDEDAQRRDSLPLDPNLKYDRSGPHPILLVPQPSDDPNDPLVRPILSPNRACTESLNHNAARKEKEKGGKDLSGLR